MIDDYKQAFQEEARELLAELESALLELDQNREDAGLVGRAFRALHTIKGSGAMFGFDDIARFVHHLESAFDRLRKGQIAASADLVNLTLDACDQIKAMLDAARGLDAVDPDRSGALLVELGRLTGFQDEGAGVAQFPGPASRATTTGLGRDWYIRFRPAPEVLLNGTNPLLLLRELRQLGKLQVQLDTTGIPSLGEMDPERCYLAWDMVLSTQAERAAIQDVFIFVESECELSIEPVAEVSAAESALPAARNSPGAAVTNSLRVSADKLDQLVNLVGELVTVQARLSEVTARLSDPEIQAVSEEVERLTSSLRENSMSIRMLPLRTTFERFRRLVHDLGRDLHKEVELTTEGAETELDKTVIDQLNEPLVHLIRNCMDHGVEDAGARRAAGKPPVATIHLSALHSGAHVLIRVSDDGAGLDVDAVRARAVERGLIAANADLSEAETVSLILEAGFSTARQVTDISGRGVGLDVVRRNVEALRGSLEIGSKRGFGVIVTLRLPLTLAIIDGLLIRVGGAKFVLPLAHSLECVELTRQDIQDAHGNHIANVRGQMVPYVRLREYFRMPGLRPEREQIMVVETEHGHFGFVVDEVLGDHQTVIKNLGKLYRDVQVVSGATILGNGTVALILDPHRLVQNVIRAAPQKNRSFGVRARPESTNAFTDTFRPKEDTIDVT